MVKSMICMDKRNQHADFINTRTKSASARLSENLFLMLFPILEIIHCRFSFSKFPVKLLTV